MMNVNYNPDILTCLASLSNDEVFTPPKIVNEMLDLLPKEIWSNKDAKFLDPVSKTGVFLREIAKRLNKGLEKKIPNKQKRINHIFKNQLYAIAITELTSLISRRSTYCSKNAKGKYSVCSEFKTPEGNITFNNIEHSFNKGRCIYCGASEEVYSRGEELESHAYEFIHTLKPEEIFKMKFDVIVGNPPYQISDGGGTGDSAIPLYHKFIEQAKKLDPRFLTMIIPSRWMKGGKGLDKFRIEMSEDKHITVLHDFENANDCFPGVHIDGGVCYFLWERDREDKCDYFTHTKNGEIFNVLRYLKIEDLDIVIRDHRQISIIQKAKSKNENNFSSLISSQKPFGFRSFLFNRPQEYPNSKLTFKETKGFLRIWGIKGKKGGSKRMAGYVCPDSIEKGNESIKKYKLFFSKAYMSTATVPPKIIIGKPGEICTETFLKIGDFETEEEANNCLSYIMTKFFRALLFFNRHSLNISQSSFKLIPLQDFSKSWTDEELYKKYDLSKEEIDFIEEIIQPMNLNGGSDYEDLEYSEGEEDGSEDE
tara:strand:+ start:801 stop:2411 length:1611 start_codon:yes stop_codon:yes gene_type:complete